MFPGGGAVLLGDWGRSSEARALVLHGQGPQFHLHHEGKGTEGRKENACSHLDSTDNKTETVQKRFARSLDKSGLK